MTLGGVGGGNLNSWKTWKFGYFFLTNRWLDLNEIWYLESIHVSELLSQIPTRSLDIGGSWRGKSWKTFGVEESGWSLVDRISKCPWYMIDVTVLDSLSLGELGEGFSDLASLVHPDVLGRWKLVGVLGSCTNWLDKVIFPDSIIWGAKGRGKIRKNDVFITYEWVIGS